MSIDSKYDVVPEMISEGDSFTDIARHLGVSRQRIAIIAKGMGCKGRVRCGAPGCERGTYSRFVYCPRHKRAYDLYGDPLGMADRPGLHHGTLASYRSRGCRCAQCKAANTAHTKWVRTNRLIRELKASMEEIKQGNVSPLLTTSAKDGKLEK